MDYTIRNNARLFDDLVRVLSNHQEEPGVAEAIEDLKAAKVNYVQRSIDHMLNCLVLTMYDLIIHPPSQGLQKELNSVMHSFYTEMMQAGSRLKDLSQQYEVGGGRLLSHDEILREVDERRGTSR